MNYYFRNHSHLSNNPYGPYRHQLPAHHTCRCNARHIESTFSTTFHLNILARVVCVCVYADIYVNHHLPMRIYAHT